MAGISTGVDVGVGVPVAAAPQALSTKTAMIETIANNRLCFFIFSLSWKEPFGIFRWTGNGERLRCRGSAAGNDLPVPAAFCVPSGASCSACPAGRLTHFTRLLAARISGLVKSRVCSRYCLIPGARDRYDKTIRNDAEKVNKCAQGWW